MNFSKRWCLQGPFMLGFLCLIQPAIAETKLTVSSTFDWKSACYEYQLPRPLAKPVNKGDDSVIWRSLEVRHLDEGAVAISLPESTREWYPTPLRFVFTTPPAPKMVAEVDLDQWRNGRQSLNTANQRNGKARYWHQIWDVRQYGPLPRDCPSRQHLPQKPPASSYLSRYCEWGDLAGYTPGLFEGPFGGTPPKGTLEQSVFRLGNPSPILTFRLDFHRESPFNFIYLSWIDANRFLLPLGDKKGLRFLACTLEPSPDGSQKTLQKR